MQIDPEFRALIPALGADELRGLEASLVAEGNRDPVAVWIGHGILLDGHNRYEICRRLDIPLKPAVEIDLPSREHAKLWIRQNQLARRNLTDDQRAIIAAEVIEALSALRMAERAQKAGKAGGNGRPKQNSPSDNVVDELLKAPKLDTRAEVSRDTKLPERKLRYATEVRRVAPELAQKVRNGDATLIEAMRRIRHAEVVRKNTSIGAREAKELAGTYDVIVIDPPWPMEKMAIGVERPDAGEPLEYPVMSLEEIEALVGAKIGRHAHTDCHVFLWTTQRFLRDALKLIEAWGLRYVCTFTWHKPAGPQPLGLPCFNSEFAIYGRKGSPQFIETKAFATCFEAPRGAPSEKPELFYETLRRVTAGRRLDMFNRRAIEGFDGWGNEAEPSRPAETGTT
jgi:N6-adenosine-specific RNA methylase IME4/ParB-like chromosome segregation protein Spo0J